MARLKKIKIAATPLSTAQELAAETAAVIFKMDVFLQRNYGPRCREYEPDCCVCKGWHLRDVFKNHID